MDQKAQFLAGEGDRYFQRNAVDEEALRENALRDPSADPILSVLAPLKPARILEIGCTNGWRLDVAHQLWDAEVHGVDPSESAIADGQRFRGVILHVGTADALPLPEASVNCVVFGFCLYLCDRADLFRIASEADRVLTPDGYLVIHDFFPPTPRVRAYAHREGVLSHKMDYSTLWRWHPFYSLWEHHVMAHPGADPNDPDARLCVTVLKKHVRLP